MLSAEKTVHTAHALLHIGGLSGTAVMLAEGHWVAALMLAVVATVCMLILAGGDAAAKIIGVKVREFVRRREHRALPKQHDERGPDA
jgi:pheromone shutdown protein TraB